MKNTPSLLKRAIPACLCICLQFFILPVRAQHSGSFIVQGDINNYYPVIVQDLGWPDNIPTEMTLGRSNVHTDASWRGAIMAKFRYHTTQWGHGANFIDVDVRQNTTPGVAINNFIGGWMDATGGNGNNEVVFWLRGGGTTYYYTCNYGITPRVYDGVQNSIGYQIQNGPLITFKTTAESYVNVNGFTTNENLYIAGDHTNYFSNPLYIGTFSAPAEYKLAVNGSAIFTKAVVRLYSNWADFVFDTAYKLPTLASVNEFIKAHHHLPDIPSADSVARSGIDVGANQAALLRKVEELTLYLIKLEEKMSAQQKEIDRLAEAGRKVGRAKDPGEAEK